jgi:hypothetical protein
MMDVRCLADEDCAVQPGSAAWLGGEPVRNEQRPSFMMTTPRSLVADMFVLLLPCLTACSSTKQSAAATPTTAAATGNPATPPRPVPNLEPCPTNNALIRAHTINAGIPKLTHTLVPITALEVRICTYFPDGVLGEIGLLNAAATARFEAESNQLPTTKLPANTPNCGVDACGTTLIFANSTQHVFVYEGIGPTLHASGNTEASNGELAALPTTAWIQDLKANTHPVNR